MTSDKKRRRKRLDYFYGYSGKGKPPRTTTIPIRFGVEAPTAQALFAQGFRPTPKEVCTVRVWNYFGWVITTRDMDGKRSPAGGRYRDYEEAQRGAAVLLQRLAAGRNEGVWN